MQYKIGRKSHQNIIRRYPSWQLGICFRWSTEAEYRRPIIRETGEREYC